MQVSLPIRPRLRGVAPIVTAALLVAAAPAAAQEGHSLSLSGPSSGKEGETTVIQATGVVPADVTLNRYVNVYSIPTSVVAACPSTFQNAMQLAYASAEDGGDTVANHVPAEGNFSIPIGFTPTAANSFLLCGYLHEGVETMASATHAIEVAAAASRPVATKRPRVKQSGSKLACQRGSWSSAPTSYAYHWRVGGKKVAKANKRTLRVTRKLEGRKVQCGVRASNAAGSTTALSKSFRVS